MPLISIKVTARTTWNSCHFSVMRRRVLFCSAQARFGLKPSSTSRSHAVQDNLAVDFAGNSLDNKQLDLYIPLIAIDVMTELTVPNCLKMHSALCRRDNPLTVC